MVRLYLLILETLPILFVLGLMVVISGCATYKVINESDSGGRVYVESIAGHGLAMTRAFNFIRAKCPNGYTYTEPGGDTNGHFYDFVCKK